MNDRIILGIDPGTIVMGYGIIRVQNRNVTLSEAGILRLDKTAAHFDRLQLIFEKLVELIELHAPAELSIEEPFYGKNVQSMLKLGRAQGAAISAALHRKIPVYGYTPRKVKQSITGKGAASKEQVASMVKTILNSNHSDLALDATDAIAVALCHYFQDNRHAVSSNATPGKIKIEKKKVSGWEAFVTANPDRLH